MVLLRIYSREYVVVANALRRSTERRTICERVQVTVGPTKVEMTDCETSNSKKYQKAQRLIFVRTRLTESHKP